MQFDFIAISAGITIFSLGLLIVSIASYKKFNNPKLLFVSFVFIILLIKGILFTLSMFYPELSSIRTLLFSMYSGLFDFAILLFMFIATIKR